MVIPFIRPNQILLDSPDEPLCVGIALRIIITGKYLLDSQLRTFLHKRCRGRLAAVIADQLGLACSILNPLGKLLVDGQIKRLQPLLGPGISCHLPTNDFRFLRIIYG